MKKLKLSSISLILLGTTIVAFGIVVGIGALIKKLEITIGLLVIPILLGMACDITAVMSLAKEKTSKLKPILTLIISTLLTIFMILLLLMLRALWKFT